MPELPMPSIFCNSIQKGRGIRTISLNLNRGLFFPEAELIYCAVTQAILPYSIVNISKEIYGNATFNFNGLDFVIPEGSYLSLTELEAAMNAQLGIFPPVPFSILLTANTATNQVKITLPNVFDILILPENLASELGFPAGVPLTTGTSFSTLPVLFNDIIASGILIVAELDLQVTTFFGNLDNSNVLAQVPIQNTDIPGGVIVYPRDVVPLMCPVVNNKSVKSFNIRFVSPRDPQRDLTFLQGDCSVVLLFTAIY